MALDGRTCVQVLYDFDYVTDEGRGVSIQEGEELLLIRKTNDDWWQVLRNGENRPFYAPMSYLTIADLCNNNDVDVNANSVKENKRPKDLAVYVSNPLYSEYHENENLKSDSNEVPIPEGVTVIHIPGPGPNKALSKSPEDEGNHSDENKLEESEDDYTSIEDDGTKSTDSAYNERLQKVEEEGGFNDTQSESSLLDEPETPIYANFPLMSLGTPPQIPEGVTPAKVLFNHWSEYLDDSGRKFYFNSLSRETTWKPPRRMNETPPTEELSPSQESLSSPTVVINRPPTPPKKPKPKLVKMRRVDSDLNSSTDSLDSPSTPPVTHQLLKSSSSSSLPHGWMEFRDSSSGETYYCNKKTKEKWYSSLDDNGTMYYYAENGSESFWKLPEETEPKTVSRELMSPIRDAPQPPGLPVAPPQVPAFRSPKLLRSDRKTKTHSVLLESTLQIVPPSEKGGKSSSLPRGMAPPQRQWPQLQDGCMVLIRQGTLNKTCLLEAGRRLKKHWTQSHVALTALHLLFYKDAKSAQQINGGCKPEITLDLAGAQLKNSTENSKRKNVFEITTVLGQQILLHDDSEQTSKEWYSAIYEVVVKLPGNDNLPPLAPLQTKEKKEKKGGPLSRKKSTKMKSRESTMKHVESSSSLNASGGSGGTGDELASTSPNERKKRIRDKLKNFFLRRPSMESLREKGIIKDEPVFGCQLEHLCQRDQSTVPKFVRYCIDCIEKKDMSADGLYRASGNLSQVQKIRFQVNQDDYSGLRIEEDVHVLTGALKMFFRDMKEPLFPFDTFDNFLSAISLNDRHRKLSTITELVRKLPVVNYDTLKFLLKHLDRVTKLKDKNRMHVQNVAIVYGPTLLWPRTESFDLAVDMMHQNQIIELLLLEFNHIFR